MNTIICDAINSRRVIRFNYNGGYRTAEPYCYGVSRKGNELLRAFQNGGYSESGNPYHWKLFSVDKMTDISLTGEKFTGDRPKYNPDDSAIEETYCNI